MVVVIRKITGCYERIGNNDEVLVIRLFYNKLDPPKFRQQGHQLCPREWLKKIHSIARLFIYYSIA
jgi:hypothetical protein